jgi:hypothetical protein
MKTRLLAIVVVLLTPVVAQQGRRSSCDLRLIVRDGRDAEGQAIPGQSARIILPCISKTDLIKLLRDTEQRPEFQNRAIEAVNRAAQVSVTLTTSLTTQNVSNRR